MNISNIYTYRPLERAQTPEGRFYLVSGQHLPSVTTILSKTDDGNSYLDDWIHSVGEKEATRIRDEASALGSEVHLNLENYIAGSPMVGSFMGKALANVIAKKGLINVDHVWGSEVGLYAEGLYAGTADLVGTHLGNPAIIDFKNSRNHKKKEQISGYFMQCAAYANAHNEMYGTDIRKCVVMIANRDGKYQEFVIEGHEFDHWAMEWALTVQKYYD